MQLFNNSVDSHSELVIEINLNDNCYVQAFYGTKNQQESRDNITLQMTCRLADPNTARNWLNAIGSRGVLATISMHSFITHFTHGILSPIKVMS